MSNKKGRGRADRAVARRALRRLSLARHELFRTDPVRLLADYATGALSQAEETTALLAPQDRTEAFEVLARCVLTRADGFIAFSGDREPPPRPRDDTPALPLHVAGTLNVAVIAGDWPKDARLPQEASLRLDLDKALSLGTHEWALRLELPLASPYLIEVRAYDEDCAWLPDVYVKLTARKQLTAVEAS